MSEPLSSRRIFSGSPWEARIGYARAVRAGDWLLVAGTTATQADGSVFGIGDAAAQTHFILSLIEKVLQQAGFSLAMVVRTRLYITDISQWQAIGQVHQAFFGAVRPVATMVQVAALINPEHLVEVEVDAYLSAVP